MPAGIHMTMSTNSPLVSVIILYYKRRETIQETLRSVLVQDYPNREIILIDNCSNDDLKEVAASLGTEVKVIELLQHLGACAGRNVGIRAARGKVLVFLDDDVSFSSPFELTKMMNAWEQHPEMHILAFQVCDPDSGKLRLREWCHPRYWKDFGEAEFETYWFGEGACAIQREVFEATGLYFEPLFYGAEGADLMLRVVNNGFKILHAPQVRVGHRASQTGRTNRRQIYFFTRNYVWIAYRNFPMLAGTRYLLEKLLMMFYFAVRTGGIRDFFRGISDSLKGLRALRPGRRPLQKATLRYLAALEKGRPNIWVRFARHKEAPQL
jgi:glycosyltransferase involved in cell wall biosynthesis